MGKIASEMMVESIRLECAAIKTLRLQWPNGYEVDFKTGQFITCFWPDEPHYKRAYSLSSCALDRGFYEITIKRDGKMGTRMVDEVKSGHVLGVLPPAGRFVPVFEPKKHLFYIAGGVGVTPVRGFVREATRRGVATRITLLYSVRCPEDLIFVEEFEELRSKNANFSFHVTCTRLAEYHPWKGRRGRIEPEWVREHVSDVANTIFYACGSNEMVECTEGLLAEDLGIPKDQIKAEKWG